MADRRGDGQTDTVSDRARHRSWVRYWVSRNLPPPPEAIGPAAKVVREMSVMQPAVRFVWAAAYAVGGAVLLFVPMLFMVRIFGFLALCSLATWEFVTAARTRKALTWAARYLNLD